MLPKAARLRGPCAPRHLSDIPNTGKGQLLACGRGVEVFRGEGRGGRKGGAAVPVEATRHLSIGIESHSRYQQAALPSHDAMRLHQQIPEVLG